MNLAREVLWGHRPLTDLPAFKLMVQRYQHSPGIDKMYAMPMPVIASVADGQWHGYVFMLRGFRFMITLDPRPFPPEYDTYVLNGNTTLRGSLIDFMITHEAQQIRELSAIHNLRR